MPRLSDLEEAIKKYHPNPDLIFLEKAYSYAEANHKGQVRASGEPYLNHLIETALLACQLKLDIPSICAALLHDTIEDCQVTPESIAEKFGKEISEIVEGVTKLTRIEFESREEKQAENFRKMLIAMAKDIRVVLVKLCDRLHNMRTLDFLREEKRRAIAEETKDIYAPLANRLGIFWIKSELQDLCLKHLRPEVYSQLTQKLKNLTGESERYVESTCLDIKRHLDESGVSATVFGRQKHIGSIWDKMEKDNLAFEEIHDVIGFRVIVPSVRACYESLGVVHFAYKPVPGRFKDYIAMPKPNMYQSLHTTVIGPAGHRIEIQIRTPDMNKVADEGIAAHWRYKEGSANPAFDLQWVLELVETQQYLKNPDEFIQSVKSELFPEEVFVFTPRGDLIRLPYNSTPIDFAYAVHTDVGHHATGAKVNGQIVPLHYKLGNGDTVEVMIQKSHVPSKDWLKFVQSTKAKQRIRAFLKSEERSRSLAIGLELMTKESKKVRLSLKTLEQEGKLEAVAQEFGLRTVGDLYAEIGYGKVSASKVINKLAPELQKSYSTDSDSSSPIRRIFKRAAEVSKGSSGIRVGGFDDIVVRFARCCQPLPGDRIAGFITRGRGVSVHHSDCPQVQELDPLRKVDVTWDTAPTEVSRRVFLRVFSQDQPGLLANMTRAITDQRANIYSATVRTNDFLKAQNTFEIDVQDAKHFSKIIRNLELVPGVIKVERIRLDEADFEEV
jgi:guanosine-3',5'-bis(diphosphate) 3'-pyrophosphohydrolase